MAEPAGVGHNLQPRITFFVIECSRVQNEKGVLREMENGSVACICVECKRKRKESDLILFVNSFVSIYWTVVMDALFGELLFRPMSIGLSHFKRMLLAAF